MIYKCQGCGANPVYDPEKKKLVCPACGGEDTAEIDPAKSEDPKLCPVCMGELPFAQYTAADRCPFCGNSLIFDEYVTGRYEPKMIAPFRIGKDRAQELMKEKFSKQKFAPKDLLTAASLDKIEGWYVPFWLYDYDTNMVYRGEGRQIDKRTEGDVEITTTKHYDVERDMDASFSRIPVDASEAMPDATMDLLAPFDYADAQAFDTKYLSGFSAEYYNHSAQELKPRSDSKMEGYAKTLVRDKAKTGSHGAYDELSEKDLRVTQKKTDSSYSMFPVWRYDYKYHDESYPFYINGQTGKIVGKAPLAKERVWASAGIVFAVALAIFLLLHFFVIQNLPIWAAIVIPAVIALIYAGVNMKPSAGVNTETAQTYLVAGSAKVNSSKDTFTNTTETRRNLKSANS
ncbi:MAG: hypothetical protein K6E92_05255 [Lachnospiraceae bacterium]|nr:hypothetical protein [Lachnospiraceae bacterium]